MTKKEYAEAVATMVNGKVQNVEKNNGLLKTAVLINGDYNIGTLYYIDEHFDNNDPIEEVAERARESIKHVPQFNADALQDWEKAKDKLTIHLCNEITNAEIKRSAAEYGFSDLIMIPYLVVSDSGSMQAKVTKAMLKGWHVSENEVFITAMKNMENDVTLTNLADIIGVPSPAPIYIVSNKAIGAYGASRILTHKIQDMCKQRFPEGYTVLPSSVHEMLIVSKTEAPMKEMIDMVKQVNMSCVDPEDRLSDNAYCF